VLQHKTAEGKTNHNSKVLHPPGPPPICRLPSGFCKIYVCTNKTDSSCRLFAKDVHERGGALRKFQQQAESDEKSQNQKAASAPRRSNWSLYEQSQMISSASGLASLSSKANIETHFSIAMMHEVPLRKHYVI